MKFLEIGEGAKIDGLRLHRNIVVTDDLSKVETFVSVGKNGEVINLDADGNEVHTPESYEQKIKQDRFDFFEKIKSCDSEILGLKNEVKREVIRRKLNEAEKIPTTQDTERGFKKILNEIRDLSKDVGAQILTSIITGYIGY